MINMYSDSLWFTSTSHAPSYHSLIITLHPITSLFLFNLFFPLVFGCRRTINFLCSRRIHIPHAARIPYVYNIRVACAWYLNADGWRLWLLSTQWWRGKAPKVATKASFRISHPKSDDDATQYLTPMLPPHSDCRRRHVVPHCRHHVLCVSSSECIRTPCACVSVFSAALLSYNAATDVPRTISTPYTPPPTVRGMVCRT